MKISRDDIKQLLVESCPSFGESKEYFDFCESHHKDSMEYLLASAFVRHLAELNALNRRKEFPDVFRLIERFHMEGDKYVNEWATIGLLEAIQNTNLHPEQSSPDDFKSFLGPVTLWWWEEVELFWDGKIKPPIGSSGRPHPPDMGNSKQSIS